MNQGGSASSHAGSYDIVASGASDPDYTITLVNGTLTINPAALTLTADNQSKVYGVQEPTLTYTLSGTRFYGDAESVVTGVGRSAPTGAASRAGWIWGACSSWTTTRPWKGPCSPRTVTPGPRTTPPAGCAASCGGRARSPQEP